MALHEHQHFGRAAEACFVSQSTLSVGIAELERLLAARLVERTRRALRFTPVGEEVAARARAMIRAAEDLTAVAGGARAPLSGPLRLAAIPTVAPYILPRLLRQTARAWPRLKLQVREMLTGAACEALHRGAVDCVLLALPAPCGEVDCEVILHDPLLLATPAGETAREATVAPDAIDGARLLLLEDGHCLRDHALAACRTAGPDADAPVVAATLDTLVRLVDAGHGITLLPAMAVNAGVLGGTAVDTRAIAGAEAGRDVALAWRRDHARGDEFRLLAGTIKAAVSGES